MTKYTLTSGEEWHLGTDISCVVENVRQHSLQGDCRLDLYVQGILGIMDSCVKTIVDIGGKMDTWEDKYEAAMCIAHNSIRMMACIKQLTEWRQ